MKYILHLLPKNVCMVARYFDNSVSENIFFLPSHLIRVCLVENSKLEMISLQILKSLFSCLLVSVKAIAKFCSISVTNS